MVAQARDEGVWAAPLLVFRMVQKSPLLLAYLLVCFTSFPEGVSIDTCPFQHTGVKDGESSSLISFKMKSGPLHMNQGARVSWRFKEETDRQKNSGWESLTWGGIH